MPPQAHQPASSSASTSGQFFFGRPAPTHRHAPAPHSCQGAARDGPPPPLLQARQPQEAPTSSSQSAPPALSHGRPVSAFANVLPGAGLHEGRLSTHQLLNPTRTARTKLIPGTSPASTEPAITGPFLPVGPSTRFDALPVACEADGGAWGFLAVIDGQLRALLTAPTALCSPRRSHPRASRLP